MSIKVVTYATCMKDQLKNWELSVKTFNYDYTILGMGEKWLGWLQRTEGYLNFVRKQEPNQIVVLCDAYDLLFVKPPNQLYDKFIATGKNIIVSAEPNCCTGQMDIPDNKKMFTKVCTKRSPSNNTFIYPCAGCVIGYAGALAILYEQILNNPFDTDDQSSLDDIWIKNPDILSLDYNSEIIGTVYEPDMGSIWVLTKDNIIHNKKTGSYPCILHFPGSKGCNTNYETYNTVGKKMDKNGEFIPLYSTFNGKLYIYIGMFIFLNIFTIFIVFISNNK